MSDVTLIFELFIIRKRMSRVKCHLHFFGRTECYASTLGFVPDHFPANSALTYLNPPSIYSSLALALSPIAATMALFLKGIKIRACNLNHKRN
jgi:hypothetical protein